ncbi:MAG: aldose 1-epimerase family protein [Pirellulaceae bacterium]|nr:aldose 1-epimerase family protein [Planctomycetales bacterium]MCA9164678.1 aldose 1-epimerase family protein [Planctomycetales bacterium]MCA9226660.1 aldose 1-epimerase family protein [Planctomycetales bacterium]
MSGKSWTILDVEAKSHAPDFTLSDLSEVSRAARDCSIKYETLRGGLSDGVGMLRVDNGQFAFAVLPTRGMSLWKAWSGDFEWGWKSPVRGPVHPAFVDMGEPSGLGWLDGFDELLVRCGLESNGAPDFDENGKLTYPLHGRIGNRPAHKLQVAVDGDSGEITVRGVVEETRFHFQKLRLTSTIKTLPGESGLRIHDVVENLSASPAQAQLLYHVNFGDPLLDAGSQVVVPAKTIVPRNGRAAEGIDTWDSYRAPAAGFEEQVYFLELFADSSGQTRTLLKNAHATRGVSLLYNKKQLPCFTVWKNTTALADGYVTGLEPGTNFPNPRTYETEQQRVVPISAGTKIGFELQLQFHTDSASVQRAEKAVAALAGDREPQIFNKPQKGWCAP